MSGKIRSAQSTPLPRPARDTMSYPPSSSLASSGRGLDTDSEFEELSAPSDEDTSASELELDDDSDDEAIHFTRQSELNKLLSQAQASREDAESLRAVLEDLRKERDEAIRTSRTLRENVSSLRDQVEASLEDREKTVSVHVAEMSRLRDELVQASKQNDTLTKQLEAATSGLRQSESDSLAARKRAEQRYKKLKEEQALEFTAYMESEAARERLLDENDSLEKQLADQTATVERLEKEIEISKKERESILRVAQSKAERHYIERKEAERVSNEKADLEQTLEAFRSKSESLAMQLDIQNQSHTQQTRTHAAELTAQSTKVRQLNEELAELRRVDSDRKTMHSQLHKSHQSLRHTHEATTSELERTRDELKTVLRLRDEMVSKEASLAHELKMQGQRIQEEQERYSRVAGEIARLKQERLMSERLNSGRLNTLEKEKNEAVAEAAKYKTRSKRLQLKLLSAEKTAATE